MRIKHFEGTILRWLNFLPLAHGLSSNCVV